MTHFVLNSDIVKFACFKAYEHIYEFTGFRDLMFKQTFLVSSFTKPALLFLLRPVYNVHRTASYFYIIFSKSE